MSPYSTSFKFDTVAIVDALGPGEDPQTGVWVRDTVLAPLAKTHAVKLSHNKVTSRSELMQLLVSIERLVRDVGIAPILHFESHGTEQGIQMPDASVVLWGDLRPILTEINRGCKMNLLTVMGMCHGRHLVSQLLPTDASPVWALIGPVDEILPSRLQIGFESFYRELLSTLDSRAAVQAMNAHRGDRPRDLWIDVAEIVFCRVFRSYISEHCSLEQLAARENVLVERVTRQSNYDIRAAMQARTMARELLEDQTKAFEHFRRTFLMLDTFPENANRFAWRLDDCLGTT